MAVKLIVDTHIFFWWLEGDRRLTKHCRELIQRNEDVLVSIVSIWELAIKVSQCKLRLNVADFELQMEKNGFQLLPVTFQHAVEYSHLPLHHGDPFDRMLVAQSVTEGARLLTHDSNLSAYGAFVLVV